MIGAVETIGATRSLGTIDLLLRDREVMLARIRHGDDVGALVRTMVVTIAIAMAIVGAALGSYRGGLQIGYAAIKLPLVLLGTAALSAPALTAIGAALGRRSRLASDLALVMAALAFGALLLAACTPLILLGRALELSYHEMILATVVMFAIAGLASLRMIVHALSLEALRHGTRDGASQRTLASGTVGWRSAVAGLCVVFTLVGGQLAWALRPYLVRPRTPEVPFVRALEGSLFDAVTGAFRSARGIYTRDEAPLPESDR
ncbi:MAG: hypothetical protein H0T89_13360 [Deltaproteobacteria bacterium]|nr:hypothetical protein [Deltaproteobacteria bacterium]